jgi:geranylgeranyl reductase family protein
MNPRPGLPLIDEAEVVVIGAGPAGSAAALTLAAHGHDVLIVDKAAFPRDKPCGDGLPRFAVSCLERFGLGPLLRDSPLIEGGRLVCNQTSEELKGYRHGHGRCVTRVDLDSALLNRALEAGARLITARVTGPVIDDDRVTCVTADRLGGPGWIRGSYFVAADGPTSIMRHRLGLAKQRADISGYAVRQYFDVEHSLDPLFDIYVPIKCGDRGLVGYGWVFPVGERRANIGVGFYRSRGDATPPLRAVLMEFLTELRTRQERRFGQIVPLGKQFGSPISMNFSPHACQWANVMFVGDSAGMTDPLTGEGISSALAGGEEAGNYLHEVLHRPAARAPGDGDTTLGARLARISVRLGQNIGMPARVADQALREHPDRVGSILASRFGPAETGQPLLHQIYQMWAGDDIERTLDAVSTGPGISGVKGLPEALAELSEQAQDYLRPTFPFAAEIIQRRLREGHGRLLGASLFASILACGGVIREEDITIALAYELVNMFPDILAQVVDKPKGTRGKLNNAIAVIVADYVLTRCLKLVSALGTQRVVQLARAGCAVCEAGLSEIVAADDPEQSRAATGTRSATLYALLGRIGAETAGSSPAIAAALETYGHHLGLALAGQGRAHAEKARNSVTGLIGITPEPLFALADFAAEQCAEFADAGLANTGRTAGENA